MSRFGSGLVIYWHGCTDAVAQADSTHSGVLARTSFPKEWYFPTGERAVPGSVPAFDAVLPELATPFAARFSTIGEGETSPRPLSPHEDG